MEESEQQPEPISISHTDIPDIPPSIPHEPAFTVADERRELATLTIPEMTQVEADLRGITDGLSALGMGEHGHDGRGEKMERGEEQQRRKRGLAAMRMELDKIMGQEREAFDTAMRQCPDLVDDESRVEFLERDGYDAKLAARRLMKYWSTRLDIFGPTKCYLPLKLSKALNDEIPDIVRQSPFQLLPQTDTAGRAVIVFDPSQRNTSKYSTKAAMRFLWYLSESQAPSVRRKGLVILILSRAVQRRNLDPHMPPLFQTFWRDVSPVPLRSMHVCQPNAVSYYVIIPIVKYLLGRHLRLRFKCHYGGEDKILADLEGYCLPRDRLPTELGGDVVLNLESWVEERAREEEAEDEEEMELEKEMEMEGSSIPACRGGGSSSGEEDEFSSNVEGGGRKAKRMRCCDSDDEVSSRGEDCSSPTATMPATGGSTSAASPQTSDVADSSDLWALVVSKVGRKSDPRMAGAIVARLTNPDISLLDALLAGGFTFQSSKEDTRLLPGSSVFDSDGVSLIQRKNQLSRRLRQLKKKHQGIVGGDAGSDSGDRQDITIKKNNNKKEKKKGSGAKNTRRKDSEAAAVLSDHRLPSTAETQSKGESKTLDPLDGIEDFLSGPSYIPCESNDETTALTPSMTITTEDQSFPESVESQQAPLDGGRERRDSFLDSIMEIPGIHDYG